MRTMILTLVLLGGCSTWGDRNVQRYPGISGQTWDAANAVVGSDGLYVRLPYAGLAVRIAPGEEPEAIGFDDERVLGLEASDDGTVLLSSVSSMCLRDGELESLGERGCPSDDLVQDGLLRDLGSDAVYEAGTWYRGFDFSSDGRYAASAVDPDAIRVGGGLVGLDTVLVLDLAQGTQAEVSIGFAPNRLLYIEDSVGAATGMIVLSESEVAVVDLTQAVPVVTATYPLTLDADDRVDPVDVVLTPDGSVALISIAGSSDLYALDLIDPSINIVSLAAVPSRVVVDPARDRTLITYGSRSAVDVLEHDLFTIDAYNLDEPMTDVVMGEDVALLHGVAAGRRDVYRLDLETFALTEYRLNFVPRDIVVSDDLDYAITLSDESNGRLEVLDLREQDGRVDDDPKPFGLDAPGVGVAFAPGEAGPQALVLLAGIDTLYRLSMATFELEEVLLTSPPVAIGSLLDGSFYVTHPDGLGLVTFLNGDGTQSTVGGFARFGLFDPKPSAGLELEEY